MSLAGPDAHGVLALRRRALRFPPLFRGIRLLLLLYDLSILRTLSKLGDI